jgi:hypothetical protein
VTAALTSVGVQQVSITIGNGATSNTATITAVGAGAFIIWQGQTTTDSTTAASAFARIELTNSTTVTATRNTSSTDTVTINALVVDGDTTNLVKSVQSGTVSIASGSTSGTASISAVTNANTAIFYLGTSTAAAANLTRDMCNVSLSGTTVTAARNASNGACVVGFCVVEFQSAALASSTQNVTITSTASGTSFATTITSVTTANAMIAYGGMLNGVNTGDERKDFYRLSLASSTSVQMDCNTAPAGTSVIAKCVVIEFASGILAQSVQRSTISLSAATSNTATITSATAAQTACNWLGNSSDQSTFGLNDSICRITQTNDTTLTMNVNTSGSPVGSYEVITFNPAQTGIAFDAATNSTYQAASSSYSWSHTCTGSNRYLVVGIAMFSLAQSVSSITYAGESLALLGLQASITGACRIELWGIDAPNTGSNTIAVTLSGAIASAGCAASYTGVNQSSPTEAYNSAQATNVGAADATVNITTVADNDWVVDIVATDDTAITVGAGNTSRNNVTGTAGSGAMADNNAAKTPAGSVTMSWTNIGALATWAIGGIALRPTAASNLPSKVFRKTLSGPGTRVGVRQLQGWG